MTQSTNSAAPNILQSEHAQVLCEACVEALYQTGDPNSTAAVYAAYMLPERRLVLEALAPLVGRSTILAERAVFNAALTQALADGIALPNWSSTAFKTRYSLCGQRVLRGLALSPEWCEFARAHPTFDLTQLTLDQWVQHNSELSAGNRLLASQVETRRSIKQAEKLSTNYECKKCGAKSAKIHQSNTRAQDEMADFMATCTICSHRWKLPR